MNTNALKRAIKAALKQLESSLPVATNTDQTPPSLREAMLEHKLSEGIHSVLAEQEEFARPMMISSLSGATGFHPQFVAPMLLREARRRQSAEAAVAWLQKVLATERAAGIAVATFWGLSPRAKIALLPDVQLMPFDSLPPSRQKEALAEPHYESWPRLATPPFAWQAPKAALVLSVEIEPYLRAPSDESEDSLYHTVLFGDIRLCLATAGPTAVIPGPGWFQYTDSDLECAILGAGSNLPHQEVTPLVLDDSSEFNPDRAVALLHDFMNLEAGLKNRARIAMERLGQAIIRRSPADTALELAIALEALLVESPGEHNFKIGLRAALLTSTDLERRKRNRAIVEGMYKIRSSLMHSGQFSDTRKIRGYGRMSTKDVVSEALEITASLIQTIIGRGSIPDWGSIELSSLQ